MRSSRLTPLKLLHIALMLWVSSWAVVLGSGCAGGAGPGRQDPALQSYVQGVMAYQQGNTDQAVADFQSALAKKHDLVMARSMLGDIYRSQSKYDAAREQYEALTRLDPYDYLNHYRLGLVYQFLERLQDAVKSYLSAITLKPTDSPSNMNLGTVYLALGNPQAAMQYAEKAADLDPLSAPALANLGVTLDANRQYDRAETAYRKSLDLNSDQPLIRLYLGENLLQQKKYSEARSVLSELIKVQDTPLHRKRYGDAFFGEKKFAEAITQYQAALKLDPLYYPALNEIGAVYIADYEKGLTLDDGKRKAALDAWQQSLAINRQQPRITALLQKYSKAPMFQP